MTEFSDLVAAIAAAAGAPRYAAKKLAKTEVSDDDREFLLGKVAELRSSRLPNGLYAMPEWVYQAYASDHTGPTTVYVSSGGEHKAVTIPEDEYWTTARKRESAFMLFNVFMAEFDAAMQPLSDETKQARRIIDVRRAARIAAHEAIQSGYTP